MGLSDRGVEAAMAVSDLNRAGIKTDERGAFDAGRFRAAWFRDPDGKAMAITEAR
jgi:hypothetical protein